MSKEKKIRSEYLRDSWKYTHRHGNLAFDAFAEFSAHVIPSPQEDGELVVTSVHFCFKEAGFSDGEAFIEEPMRTIVRSAFKDTIADIEYGDAPHSRHRVIHVRNSLDRICTIADVYETFRTSLDTEFKSLITLMEEHACEEMQGV